MKSKATDIQVTEFGLADMIGFIRKSWMLVASSTAIGIIGAAVFLVSAPQQYEATASIRIAQLVHSIDRDTTVSIETPAMLVDRLRLPSTYSAEALQSCGLSHGESEDMLAAFLRVTVPRDQSSAVKVTLRRVDENLARQCAVGIFEMIRGQHMAMLQIRQDELRGQLEFYTNRLKFHQESMIRMEKSGLPLTVNYLVHGGAAIDLLDKIDDVERFRATAIPTRLISPVYVTSDPVYPKRGPVIVLGILAGSLLGVLFALGRAVLTAGSR